MRKSSCILLAVLAVGCSTSSTAPRTGSLTVTVAASANVTVQVTVTGPNGFRKTVTSTVTLTGLAPGSYAITAPDVTTTDSIVGSVFHATIAGTPATVSASGASAATVTYSARAGSGGLWIVGGSASGSNTANTAIEYAVTQLHASSSTPPVVKLNFPITAGGNIDASGVAFDAQGNLWVVNDNSNTVVEYAVAQLSASGSPTPVVTIQLPAMSVSYAIAFDASGNLWVGNNFANTIVEFTPSQLAAGGSPTPAVTIAEVPPQPNTLQEPIGLAFDTHGNLWVANNAASSIVEYTPSQLATSGSPAPTVTLTGAAILYPNEIAFDHAGNLWITNSAYNVTPSIPASGRIVEYAAQDLTTTGSPTAVLTLNLPQGTYGAVPTGLAFDDSGNLWYADAYTQSIGQYSAASLTAGGSPSPAIIIPSATAVSGVGIAFNPHSTALPLH
jgi:sugar lactone lactonase YvrE